MFNRMKMKGPSKMGALYAYILRQEFERFCVQIWNAYLGSRLVIVLALVGKFPL